MKDIRELSEDNPILADSIPENSKRHKLKRGSIFDRGLSENGFVICSILFIVMAGLEALAFTFKGFPSVIASRVWLLFLTVFLILIIRRVILGLVEDIRTRRFEGPFMMACMIYLIFYGFGSTDIRWIDYEAAQQVTAGLDALAAPDFRYTELAFIGYPARQYIMLALPSVFAGRNMPALHFGFSFIFALSSLAMYSGLKEYFKMHKPHLAAYSSIITLMTLTSPIVYIFTRICEQALLPSAFTMMGIGCFLIYICKVSIASVLCLAFCGVTLASMYTPGFASAALLIAALMRRIAFNGSGNPCIKHDEAAMKKALDASIIFITGVTFLYSFRLVASGSASLGFGDITAEFLTAVIKQILFEKPYGLFRMFTPVVLIFAVLAALGVFKTSDLQLVLWACLTIIASISMKGWWHDQVSSVQRGTVTVPVLACLIGVRAFEYIHICLKQKFLKHLVSYAFCVYIIFIVLLNAYKPIYPRNINPSAGKILTRIVLDAQDVLKRYKYNEIAPPVMMYFSEEGNFDYPDKHMKYINPEMRILSSSSGVIDEPYSLEHGVIIYARGSAAIPIEYQSMGQVTTATWLIDGNEVAILRLLIPPQ